MAAGLAETVALPKNKPLIAGGFGTTQSQKSPATDGDTEPLKMEYIYTNSQKKEEETNSSNLEREGDEVMKA